MLICPTYLFINAGWSIRLRPNGCIISGPDPATTASLELLRPLLAALSSLRGIVQALNRF